MPDMGWLLPLWWGGNRRPRPPPSTSALPTPSPAGTGRRSGLWDSRDRRTRKRSRPRVAATSAAPTNGTCIRRGGARGGAEYPLEAGVGSGGAQQPLSLHPLDVGARRAPSDASPPRGGTCIRSLTRLPSYQKWKQKQKIDDRDSEDEGTSHQRGPERRGGKRGRGQGNGPQSSLASGPFDHPGTWFSLVGLSPSAVPGCRGI